VLRITVLSIRSNLSRGISGSNSTQQHQHLHKMDANRANTVEPLRQMLLRSQGPVDQLDTTHLNPAGSYVCSYNYNGQCNVNASYNTFSLQIREKRRELVCIIVAILGNDPRDWFERSLKPRELQVRPLDWSTTLLQRLRIFAQSLPCDLRSTTVGQRLRVAHQKMLAEAGSYDNSAKYLNTQQTNEPSPKSDSNEHNRLHQICSDKVQAMREENEEIDEMQEEKWRNDLDLEVLENRLKDMPKIEQEVQYLRTRNAWLDLGLAIERQQASYDQI
jgi:hypothetical protein